MLKPAVIALVVPFFVGCAASGALPGAPELVAVDSLDADRYFGKWYEIAKYPNSFEKGLVGVTAEYSRRDDGKVRVLNSGWKDNFDGKLKSSEAKAWVPEASETAKLKVQFFWPFTGDYWVIALDPDYRWSVVGEPKRRYLWILSRSPRMDETTYEGIVRRIAGLGYDTARLEKMPQPASAE